jgi:hypothetical protein
MNDDGKDYDDPDVEEAWCDERRAEVTAYVDSQGLARGDVGDWPAWHVAPLVSIWAIESGSTSGAIGWWVIAGDLPTDYIPGRGVPDPREAVRMFAERWQAAAAEMRDGRDASEIRIAVTPQERRALGPMLESRAVMLARWADDDAVWVDLFDQ